MNINKKSIKKMNEKTNLGIKTRRNFIKQLSAGAAGLTISSFGLTGCALNTGNFGAMRRTSGVNLDDSRVSFITGNDQREATYQALKPLEKEIEKAIKDKQVVIKSNIGQIRKEWWLNASDANQIRGILDFLKPIYDKKVIVAESTAAGAKSTLDGFKNYNYMPILKEYNVKFVDLNDRPTITKWILDGKRHPLGINIIDMFLDPNIYMISATRLKTHNCVIATLSLKNIVMASPKNHYKRKSAEGRNEKPNMHAGERGNTSRHKGLSTNLFLVAQMGIQPDLAVLDGVVGMEGDGPVTGTPVEQGVALASTDWLAADRLGVELMGIDYSEVMYLQWCGKAGMGRDDLSKINIIGPDYTKHIIKYKMHKNIEEQREWIKKDLGV